MRLIFLLIFCQFTSIVLISQPVIESDGFTNAETVLTLESPGPQWFASQTLTSQAGEDQTWEILDWNPLQINEQSYYPLSQVPFAYQIFFNSPLLYPEHVSTHGLLAQFDPAQLPLPIQVDEPYTFFRTDETGYYSTGNAFSVEGLPVITQNDSIERIYKFPMNFGDTDTTGIGFLTEVPFLGSYGQNGIRINEVDGWGVLNTPYGNYDVLRIRSEIAVTDTFYIAQTDTGQSIERPLEIEYTWLSPEVPGPVLVISEIQGAAVSASLYVDDGVLSVENSLYNESEPAFYPNPARRNIKLNPRLNCQSVMVLDHMGREVLKNKTGQLSISIGQLPRGCYLVVIQEQNGKTIREKLIIE